MDNSKITPEFKRKFQESFWWAAPISVAADLIAIWSLFNFKQQSIDAQPVYTPGIIYSETKVFGIIGISDAIVLTGFFTVFIIVSTIYLAITASKSRGDLWPSIWGTFLSLLVVWSYFRLWLGEYGWLLILLAFVVIAIVITILLFNTTTISDTFRVGCVLITAVLVVITIFLVITTGAMNQFMSTRNSHQPESTNNVPNQPPTQNQETYAIPTLDISSPTSVIASPTSPIVSRIAVSLPTLQELADSPNIWGLFKYENPTHPTTLTYNATIQGNYKYRWGAVWCGTSKQILREIIKPLTMTLLIDGQIVDKNQILEFDETVNGWVCHRWATLISGWQSSTTVKLELSYFLSKTIYDGVASTQAGEYHLIIFVSVP